MEEKRACKSDREEGERSDEWSRHTITVNNITITIRIHNHITIADNMKYLISIKNKVFSSFLFFSFPMMKMKMKISQNVDDSHCSSLI